MPLSEYVLRRLRQAVPANCNVVPESTPVISFGDFRTARVATLGLNPSNLEFVDKTGRLLSADERRLATTSSLSAKCLSEISHQQAERIVDDCVTYFQRKPYRRWFDQLEPILDRVDSSYYDGSACHLDLVQWATHMKWNELSLSNRQELLQQDTPFLAAQLEQEKIKTLLLNGASVIRYFQKSFCIDLEERESLTDHGHRSTQIFCGRLFDRVIVIGWSTNIQSSFGVTSERRRAIATAVARLATEAG